MFCFRNKVPGRKIKKYTAFDLLANSDCRWPLLSCGPADNSVASFRSYYHQASGSRRKERPRRDSKHIWNSLVWHLRHCFRSNLVSFWAYLPQCTSPYTGPHAPSSTTRYWLLKHIPTFVLLLLSGKLSFPSLPIQILNMQWHPV